MSFPTTPTDGQIYNDYKYNASLTTWKKFSVNDLFPIGMMYMQLPGMSEPSTLGWPGTWSNVSVDYAGDFFRVEGGNAEVFDGGEQLDALQGHRHAYNEDVAHTDNGNGYGYVKINVASPDLTDIVTTLNILDPISDGVNGPPRTNIETRPINKTIRVWKRTA